MLERAFTTPTYETSSAKLAYNIQFDQAARQQLDASAPFLDPKERQRRQNQLHSRTLENLKSEIRERFCTLEYQTSYSFQDGHLVNTHHDEPFLKIIQRGVDYRQKHGSGDTTREEAELIGFERIEQLLQEDSEAKTVVSFSPRGSKDSAYQQNFFDIFQKQKDGTILLTRFTSTASYEDFQKAARKLNPSVPQPIAITDAYFLAHPVATTASVDEIIQLIELDQSALAKEYVESIIEKCLPIILTYVKNPSEENYEAAVNLADILAGKKTVPASRLMNSRPYQSTIEDISFLSSLPVRQVATGCGISGSKTSGTGQSGMTSLWSVADFGTSDSVDKDHSDFPCPQCGYMIIYGSGAKQCPSCGLEATCD